MNRQRHRHPDFMSHREAQVCIKWHAGGFPPKRKVPTGTLARKFLQKFDFKDFLEIFKKFDPPFLGP